MNEKRLRNIVKEYKDSHNRDFAPKTAYDEKQAYANKCLGQLVTEIERTKCDIRSIICKNVEENRNKKQKVDILISQSVLVV